MGKGLQKVPETGIYLVHGQPGSGKSYGAVKQIIDEVVKSRRIVYTNLPLRFKTMRAYLSLRARADLRLDRHDARRLGLFVRPLTEAHFLAFCRRLRAIDRKAGEILRETGGNSFSELPEFAERKAREAARQWVSDNVVEELDDQKKPYTVGGPEILTGRGANWIPPMAALYIDELHKWFPNATVSKEPGEVLAYTSMHRHMMHKVVCLTQDVANVSVSFRRMAVEFCTVRNLKQTQFLWGTKWPVLVMTSTRYYAGDVRTGELRRGAKALGHGMEIPYFDGGVIFRLYDSHSHVVSLEAARESVRALHREISAAGGGGFKMRMPRTAWDRVADAWLGFWARLILWPLRRWKWAIVLFIGLYVAYAAGGGGVEKPKVGKASASRSGHGSAVVAATSRPALGSVVLSGITNKGVVVDGQYVKVGGSWSGYRLAGCNVEEACTLWVDSPGGVLWWLGGRLCRVGKDGKPILGSGGQGQNARLREGASSDAKAGGTGVRH